MEMLEHTSLQLTDHPALRAMFQARKRVFIDLLGWHVPVLVGQYEVDQFDTPDAAYPGTHRRLIAGLDDLPEPQVAQYQLGSAICFLGSTSHGARANQSGSVRRGVVVGYNIRWLKPHENPWLAYLLSVAKRFSPNLRELAGYIQHWPNLGNVEGNCPLYLLDGSRHAGVGATDASRSDQAAAVAEFATALRSEQ